MSDFETPDIAKQRAKVRAEQNAAEHAGVYVKSYTKTVNHVVKIDEINAIASTIIKIIDENYIIEPLNEVGGSFRVKARIKVIIDSNNIDNWLKREHQRSIELVEQNKKLQLERQKQDQEIQFLKNRLSTVNNQKEKLELENMFANKDRVFLSLQKVSKGNKLFYTEGKSIEAITLFSQAIELNEYNDLAYLSRGQVYNKQGNYKRALNDFNKAIDINHNNDDAYVFRAITYRDLGDIKKSTIDFNKAIIINSQNTAAYVGRSINYCQEQNYPAAVNDCNKALELDSKNDLSYVIRGLCYALQDNYQQAIDNYNKALEINPLNTAAYIKRGIAFGMQEKYLLSIADFDKAISIDPEHAGEAYYNRGVSYEILGNMNKANSDYRKAKSLGYSEEY